MRKATYDTETTPRSFTAKIFPRLFYASPRGISVPELPDPHLLFAPLDTPSRLGV